MFVHYQVKFNRSYLLNENTMVMGLSYIKELCSQLFLRSKLLMTVMGLSFKKELHLYEFKLVKFLDFNYWRYQLLKEC